MFKKYKTKRLYESTSGQLDAIDQLFGDMFCEPLVKYEKLNKDVILNGLKEMIDEWVEDNPEMIKSLRFNSTSVDINREYLIAIRINDEQFIRDFGQLYLDKLPGKSKVYLLVNEDRDPVKIDANIGVLNCYNEDDYIYIEIKNNNYYLYDFDNKKEIDKLGTEANWFDNLLDYNFADNEDREEDSLYNSSKEVREYTKEEKRKIIEANGTIFKRVAAISYIIGLLYKNNKKLTELNNDKKLTKKNRVLFKEIIETIDINYISVNYNTLMKFSDEELKKIELNINDFNNVFGNYKDDDFKRTIDYLQGNSDVIEFTTDEFIQIISKFIIKNASIIRENLITIQSIEFPDLIQLNTDNLIVLSETVRDSFKVLQNMMDKIVKSMRS